MTERLLLAAAAVAAVVAALVWARSARRLRRVAVRIQSGAGGHAEASRLAWIAYRKDAHATAQYGVAAGVIRALVQRPVLVPQQLQLPPAGQAAGASAHHGDASSPQIPHRGSDLRAESNT